MPGIAAGAGVDVDVVDSGGQGTMTRPDPGQEVRGPIAAALAGRLDGSARQVDAVGERVTQAASATVDDRVSST